MPFVTTMNARRQGKSLWVYNQIELNLIKYKSVLVCVNYPATAIPRLREYFPRNVMEVIPNCGIKIYQREFGK